MHRIMITAAVLALGAPLLELPAPPPLTVLPQAASPVPSATAAAVIIIRCIVISPALAQTRAAPMMITAR